MSAGRKRAGYILMAAALMFFGPGAGTAQGAAAAGTVANKAVVSQNKVKKEDVKNKKEAGSQPTSAPAASASQAAPQPAAGSPVMPVPQATAAPGLPTPGMPQIPPASQSAETPQATAAPQVTTPPQMTEEGEQSGKPSGDGGMDTGSQREGAEDSKDAAAPTITGGGEKDVPQEGEGGQEIPGNEVTGNPAEDLPAEDGNWKDHEEPGTGSVSGNTSNSEDIPDTGEEGTGTPSGDDQGTEQAPDGTDNEDGADFSLEEPSYIEETKTPEPTTAGVTEGPATIIVGGLVPYIPGEDQNAGTEPEEEIVEDMGNEEDQSMIAGSTPLVGAAIADDGYGNGGSKSKSKKTAATTPRATTAPASARSSSTGGSTSAPTATAAASDRNSTVAMASSGQNQVVPTAAPSGGNGLGGLRVAGVRTEDSTKILPFVLVGAVALAAVIALVAVKIKRGRKNLSDREQE